MQKRFILLLLCSLIFVLNAKIELQKDYSMPREPQKRHPLEEHFGITPERAEKLQQQTRSNDRLLVMMVEFQEDSTSTTTGNGKFVFSDPDYQIDIGKPPHNQEYFWWVMESVRYYYQAASLGAYNLHFDVFPTASYSETDSVIVAYTLPQQMSYYNPVGADNALMISRFEEYFHDVFTTVDQDETVDFSRYDHFMIIHAGSDSQHDIMGDSPSDIPSFFINVGDGKEVIVDDGIVIDHACNVPETISQDGQYGVTTAVTAHEFGHSLGFVDLYSTLTGGSQVGWYDIMDSGGMGELVVTEIDGEYISVEGGLPTLPNAWHRIMVWEDYFRQQGILKDIDELDWTEDIRVVPAEKIVEQISSQDPYFIKIPLTDKEYLLIENRQVDPDGDSGLSFKGGLPQYPNEHDKGYRILLYPTYPAPDPRDEPNWEYDLFLPGWQGEGSDGRTYDYGGGLLIWHIDDSIIYETGDWIDGEFYSNYDQNTVNALHTERGVKIIEADGFDNIGNYDDSYNMLGSAYDPFYRYYPLLDGDGDFLGWDNSGVMPGYVPQNEDDFIHTVEFHGNSQPQLTTNSGEPFMFGLWNISSYSLDVDAERVMSFHYGSHLFDEVEIITEYDDINSLSAVMNNNSGFPAFLAHADGEMHLQTLIGDQWANHFGWSSALPEPQSPIISVNYDLDESEFAYIADSTMVTVNDLLQVSAISYDAHISDIPLKIYNNGLETLIVPLEDKLLIGDSELPVADAVLSYDGEYLLAAETDRLCYIDVTEKTIVSEYDLPESEIRYYPVAFENETSGEKLSFMITSQGQVYRNSVSDSQQIFDIQDYTTDAPSQILLTPLEDDGRTWLIFAAGEYLFVITDQGTLSTGFPVVMENRPTASGSWLSSMKLAGEYLILLQRDTGSMFAVNHAGEYRIDFSSSQPGSLSNANYWWDEQTQILNWIGETGNGQLINGRRLEVSEDPVVNSGYRNNSYNIYRGVLQSSVQQVEGFSAYAFPNPAKSDHVTLRVFQSSDDISVTLYDIAGHKVMSGAEELEDHPYQDMRLDLEGISSGVYYAHIKSGSNKLIVAIGVEK